MDFYTITQTTGKSVITSEKTKDNRKVIINIMFSLEKKWRVWRAHSSDWLVTTSDAGALGEERAQNKDKFNVLIEVEKVAVDASAGAAAFNDIEGEQYDIHAEDPSGCQNSSNVAKTIQDTAAISTSSVEEVMLKETNNISKNKSLSNNKITASSSNVVAQKSADKK